MINNILDTLKISASNDDFDSRRTHERRHSDSCIAIVNGHSYPVKKLEPGRYSY